jgi:hypothetical protein
VVITGYTRLDIKWRTLDTSESLAGLLASKWREEDSVGPCWRGGLDRGNWRGAVGAK